MSADINPFMDASESSDDSPSLSSEGEDDALQDSLNLERLEDAEKKVCSICWRCFFSTIKLEQFGRQKIPDVDYVTSDRRILHAAELGCPWCLLLTRRFSFRNDLEPDFCTISLSRGDEKFTPRGGGEFTPRGANVATLSLSSNNHGEQWEKIGFRARGDNVAGRYITARMREPDVSPLATCKQILQWLDDCTGHQSCQRESESRLPTRLIDVRLLKIVETTGRTGRYAALSYCWGTSRQPTLSKCNLESYSQDLVYEHLPQTIKDAIQVTKCMDIPYLWVDALCIIQDDETDKIHELGSMGRIYMDAYITIAASNASNVHEGFLRNRSEDDLTIPFPVSVKDGIFGEATVRTKWDSEPGSNPIHTRAWTLQEHVLAKRLLNYSSRTLQWRCQAGLLNLADSRRLLHTECNNGPPLLNRSNKNPSTMLSWYLGIVENFSSRSLSLPSDKLPALAALAEELAPVLGPEYHAGIWKYDMVKQLAWRVGPHHPSRWHETAYDRTDYRAPSWSWASVGAQIEYRTFSSFDGTHLWRDKGELLEDACTIISVKTQAKFEEAPYGEVVSGSLTVRAKLLLVWASLKRPLDAERSGFSQVLSTWSVGETPSRFLSKRKSEHTIPTEFPNDSTRLDVCCFMDGPDLEPQTVGFVFLLPLYLNLPKYNSIHVSVPPDYDGIIVHAHGGGDFCRIGYFESLSHTQFDGAEEGEITIV